MNALEARIAALTDQQLEAATAEIYATTDHGEEHRLVAAALADELTRRWGIEAELDRVFQDDTFTGTYYQAMLIARQNLQNGNNA